MKNWRFVLLKEIESDQEFVLKSKVFVKISRKVSSKLYMNATRAMW